MRLLEADTACFTVLKLEGDAPRPVDMNRVAWGPVPAQSMEVETWEIHVRRLGRGVEGVDHDKRPGYEVRAYPSAPPRLKEFAKAFVLPGSDHSLSVNPRLSYVNR